MGVLRRTTWRMPSGMAMIEGDEVDDADQRPASWAAAGR